MPGTRKATMLIIKDDPVAVAIQRFQLNAQNFRVIVANKGEEGIELAHQEVPDLILMGLVLPGKQGLEATSRPKNDPDTKKTRFLP